MRILLLLIFSLVFTLVSFSQTLLYYDPDGNLRKIVDINAEGNKLFGKLGIKFIVAADDLSFSKAFEQYSPQFVILNSIIYSSKKSELGLSPLAIFTKKGKYSYTKKVVSFSEDVNFGMLKNKILSSSFKSVNDILGFEPKVLKVPKDLDALLAIKFRQADVALVSEDSIEIFKAISPVDYNMIKVIYTSKSIYNPVLCATKFNKDEDLINQLISTLGSQEAKSFLGLLLFDGITTDSKILLKIK
ncbi:MAG: hypothetical protein ACPL4C_00375 [Brevinematia bacterium]